MEKSLKSQYENANNISARIRLHKDYSTNKQGWFPWIYETAIAPVFNQTGISGRKIKILELGCGDGSLWTTNLEPLPSNVKITLSDISEGMIRDARRNLGDDKRFGYASFDCHQIPYKDDSYDLVIANLVLHYIDDLDTIYRLIYHTLCPGGVFIMNIEHPTFTAGVDQQFADDGTWPIDGYYYPGARQTNFLGRRITKYHHTLTQILNGLICAGFSLEAVEEAMPPEEWRAIMPDEMRRPMMLLVKASKKY
jgi:SAM-dependent methyltransferase